MRRIKNLFLRYALIVLVGLGNLKLFYFIFTPLTVFLSYLLLSVLGEALVFGNSILFNSTLIELVEACIAGSAYYLLFVLSMSISNIGVIKRIKIIFFSFSCLLVLNVLRIIFMALILNNDLFNQVHLLFWYFVSIVFVAGIWFFCVKIFKIKTIPFYSDLLIIKNLKNAQTRKKND